MCKYYVTQLHWQWGIGLGRLSGASVAKSIVWVFAIWAGYTAFFIGVGALIQAGVKQITG